MAEKKQDTSIELIGKFDQLLIDSKNLIHSETVKDDKKFNELIEFAKNLNVVNVDSKSIYDQITTQLKEITRIEKIVDKKRKEFTAPAVAYQKDLIKYGDTYLIPLAGAKKHLTAEKQKFDDLVKAEANRIFSERTKLLAESGYQLVGKIYMSGPVQIPTDTIADMDQEGFDYHVGLGKAELERQQAEKDRIEQAEKDRAAFAKERAEFAKEKAEFAKQKAEILAQQQALDETYKSVEEPKVEEPETKPSPDKKPAEKVEKIIVEKGASLGKSEIITKHEHPKPNLETSTEKEEFGDIFDKMEISPEQIGFNQCQKRVLEIMDDKSITKKSILKERIKSIEYVLEEKK